jgi:hypothetical protein
VIDVLEPDKLRLFFFFALPGVIGVYAWDLLVPGHERKAPEQLLRGVTFSIVNTVLVWPLADAFNQTAPRWAVHLGIAFVLLVLPVAEAAAVRALLGWRWLRARCGLRHPVPTPWDHFFGRGETCWLIVHMKSGRRVAGYFGADSFASSFPHPEKLYMQELWVLDDRNERRFHHQAPRSRGVMVSMVDCESIEMFSDEPEGT